MTSYRLYKDAWEQDGQATVSVPQQIHAQNCTNRKQIEGYGWWKKKKFVFVFILKIVGLILAKKTVIFQKLLN